MANKGNNLPNTQVNIYKHKCYLAEILALPSPMLITPCGRKGTKEALFFNYNLTQSS